MHLNFATIGAMDCFGHMLRPYRLLLCKYSADRLWPGAITIKESSDHVLTAINMQEFAWRYG